jgi:DNA polymerase-3 subunit epsilon
VRRIVLDTDTTGLGVGHRTIEIGYVEMISRTPTGRRFHRYINPEREIDPGAMAVHGLTPEFLADKPTFREIADDLVNFISDAELIMHNAPFDAGFLNYELNLLVVPEIFIRAPVASASCLA